ncbi:MAG: hypothetical protein ACRD0K_14000 [Egibacteraceae bacterium]
MNDRRRTGRARLEATAERHLVWLAYRPGVLSARCRCGWEGASYQLRAVGRAQALRAAERDAVTHETKDEQ